MKLNFSHRNQESMETIMMWRRWRWIRHVTHRKQGNITCTALHWTPEGKRKWGRPKNTWWSSRPYSTPGESFRSLPRTDRSGDPLLLPYMPGGIHGHEWVSDKASVNHEDLDVDFILQHFNLCLFLIKGNVDT